MNEDIYELEMEPAEYKRLTGCTIERMAEVCDRTPSHVSKWFTQTEKSRRPCQAKDRRLLYLHYYYLKQNGTI
jgi:hypothetical protein